MPATTNKGGTCYQDALLAVLFGPPGCVLVQGYPRLTSKDEHFGKKYGHAWVEVEVCGAWFVIDHHIPTSLIPKALYYAVGRIDPAECHTYTRREAKALERKFRHAGPWHEEPADAIFSEDL